MWNITINSYAALFLIAIVGSAATALIVYTANQAYSDGNSYSASLNSAYNGTPSVASTHIIRSGISHTGVPN